MKETIETQIQRIFIQKKLTLSIAESCTGGAISARLTRLPGCSQYFLGSIVAYSNHLKVKVLGVNEQLIQRLGAVSQEVVMQMATGVLELTGSNYSVAVSGIAGPGGGTLDKPVGTICAAIAYSGQEVCTWSFHLSGSRETIIHGCVDLLLSQLKLRVEA